MGKINLAGSRKKGMLQGGEVGKVLEWNRVKGFIQRQVASILLSCYKAEVRKQEAKKN